MNNLLAVVMTLGLLVTALVIWAATRAGHGIEDEIRREGRAVMGRVTQLGTDSGDGLASPTYWADVTCDSEPVPVRVHVDVHRYGTLSVGSVVTVSYVPGSKRPMGILL